MKKTGPKYSPKVIFEGSKWNNPIQSIQFIVVRPPPLIIEVKTNLEYERKDAIQELAKYFSAQTNPSDYVAVVTDGLTFEIYDFQKNKPVPLRSFQFKSEDPHGAYRELDEILTTAKKLPPLSQDIVSRFGLKSLTFHRSSTLLSEALESVSALHPVATKMREWNALLARVYGSSFGNAELYIKHTYLTMLSRAILTLALYPKSKRGNQLFRGLMNGDFFRNRGIQNLAEPDFFSWALDTSPFKALNDCNYSI